MKKLLDIVDALEAERKIVVLIRRTEQRDAMLQIGNIFELHLPTGQRHALIALGVQAFPKCGGI